jgi:CheY-like chemotaxis protein
MTSSKKELDRTLPAMVVDDSPVMCALMCRILKQAGFAASEFSTEAVDALSKLKSKRYSLLLTDLNMNPISGIDFIHLIWADRDILPIPVVLTSGDHHSIGKAVAEAARELADVYILKPFSAEALDRKLREAFRDKA